MSLYPQLTPRVGTLRERVTLQSVQLVDDGFGQVEQFADAATVYARVEPMTVSEQWANATVEAVNDVRIHIRWRGDVQPTWRVFWRGKTFNIIGIRNLDERRRYLTLDCAGQL